MTWPGSSAPGFSVDEPTRELSTLIKLIRVTALAPVVLVAAMVLRSRGAAGGARPPLLPGFVLAFLAPAAASSAGLVPQTASDPAAAASRWALLTAMAAVGMKTSVPRLLQVGGRAFALPCGQIVFLCLLVLGWIAML
jgi:uncharacterized membrane protein YadS